jgi:hypothetical protein
MIIKKTADSCQLRRDIRTEAPEFVYLSKILPRVYVMAFGGILRLKVPVLRC